MNVMAPTMQVACKVFIVPNPAARSPKERYTHVSHSLRRARHARCFNGECPSEATDKIGMRHIYWSAVAKMRHPYCRFHLCSCVDCAPSFRVQSVVVMVGFAFIIAFQIA